MIGKPPLELDFGRARFIESFEGLKNLNMWQGKDLIARRLLRELEGKEVVALGAGIPETIRPLLPSGMRVVSVSGNGSHSSVDVAVLDAQEVSARGELLAPGSASDEALKAPKWIVATLHTKSDGSPKLVRECTDKSGLLSPRRVDLVITELGVVEISSVGLVLKEIAPGVASDEVKMKTGASLHVADDVRTMEL